MVATAISAVIALLAYQSIEGVVTLKSTLDDKQRQLSALQRTFWQMEQDVSQMTPRPVREGMGSELPALRTTAEGDVSMTRIVDVPSPHEVGGLLRVRYHLEGTTLQRWVWPVLDRAPDTEPEKVTLLENVQSLRWRFWDDKNSAQDQWPPSQNASANAQGAGLTTLPKVVEVTLQVKGVRGEGGGDSITRLFSGVDALPLVKGKP
jgi:general secretion pathway protein J